MSNFTWHEVTTTMNELVSTLNLTSGTDSTRIGTNETRGPGPNFGGRPNFQGEQEPFPSQCYYYDIVNMITANTLLFIFGTIGNILIVLVMWKDVRKSITSFLLVNLAVSDTIVLTTYWFFQSPKAFAERFHKMTFFVKYFGYFLQKYQAVIITFMTISAWTIVLATFHRYLAVSRPVTANSEKMKKRIRYLVAFVWIGSIIYNLPRYFFLDVTYIKRADIYVASPNDFGESFGFKYIYNVVFLFSVLSVIPLSIMIFATTKLVQHMRRIQKKKAKLTSKSEQEKGMNKSLVVIVITFFFFTVAFPINNLLRNVVFTREDYECPKALYFFGRLNPTLVFVNSSINFLIYIVCSKHFRGQFLSRIGWKKNAVRPFSDSGSSGSSNRNTRPTVSTILSNANYTNNALTPVEIISKP